MAVRPSISVCEIGQQIAEALAFAHQNGVVHRDIKPANILMTSREVYGIERPKITDFGVAKLVAGQTTLSGQMLGTPAFMPPEQFTGSDVDGRADIFSLGVILYWMATGEQPFPGETMTAVSYKIVHTEAVPPSKLNPSVSRQLESVILKCLAKSPADRYQTGRDLAQDLGAVRAGGTVNRTMQQPAAFDADATIIGVRTTTVAPPAAQPVVSQANTPAKAPGCGNRTMPSLPWLPFCSSPSEGGFCCAADSKLRRNRPLHSRKPQRQLQLQLLQHRPMSPQLRRPPSP